MRGKIPLFITAILLMSSLALAADPVLRTLTEEEVEGFHVLRPETIEPILIKIEPIRPYDPILASIPKPVFDMRDIEPKPGQPDYELGEDTELEKIMQLVETYYSEFPVKKNMTDPRNLEIPLFQQGRRRALLIPEQHEKITMAPGSGKIVYGEYKMESRNNQTIPPILIKKGKKKLSQIWVYMLNDTTLRVEDSEFRFLTNKKVDVIDKVLYIDGFQMTVMPSEILPLNYNNIEYGLFLDISEQGPKYIIEYNASKGILVLDANDDLEYDIEGNTFTVEDIPVKANNRLDLGGQGFIVALTENRTYFVTKPTLDLPTPIDAKLRIRNGRLDIAGTFVTVPPEQLFEKYGSREITLVEKDNAPWYHFKTEKMVKLLFFLDKSMAVNNYVSAANVDNLMEELPWWSFLITSPSPTN
jgi:hypothetical protein